MFMFIYISAEKELWNPVFWNRTKVHLSMSFPLDILINLLIKYNGSSFMFLKTEKNEASFANKFDLNTSLSAKPLIYVKKNKEPRSSSLRQ